MEGLTDLILGLFLWLGSCFFLLIFVGSDSQRNSSEQLSSSSTTKNSFVTDDNLDENTNSQSSESEGELSKLREQLQAQTRELNSAKENILALKNELDSALNELESNQDQSAKQKLELEKQNDNLRDKLQSWQQKCQVLREKIEQDSQQLQQDWQQETFEQLNSLLANYPTARMMVKLKPTLPAENLIVLLKPLESLCRSWGLQPIGKPWQKVPFNPQQHQPDDDDIQENELVYIRFVGYRQGDRILLPAKVSRHLPGNH